jgi:hypothetical protein
VLDEFVETGVVDTGLSQSTAKCSRMERPKASAVSEVTPGEKAPARPGVSSRPRHRSAERLSRV